MTDHSKIESTSEQHLLKSTATHQKLKYFHNNLFHEHVKSMIYTIETEKTTNLF